MFRRRRPGGSDAPAPAAPDWRSYERVAEAYRRVRVPVHEGPARDLIGVLEPNPGGRLLDVGTGPGVAALQAMEAIGKDGVVAGVDISISMASLARSAGIHVAVAAAMDLPFRDGTFDAVTAAFVLHLVPKYETVLHDMVRVMRRDGKLGVASWIDAPDEFTRTWGQVAESYATKEMLADARRRAAPWAEHFSDPQRIEDSLRRAGLRDVRIERRSYRVPTTIDDYLTGRETTGLGRFLR
ncbi:MAG: methyltransferase domain-containing protein, partial [Actinomycetota bacterium]|nr:methyltransferase domain-containing protein [Actinomycetota bacterium]